MGPSFLDPQTSKDGKPFGPKRYKEIVRECWYISDNLHTSYSDILDLAYTDRLQLFLLIKEKREAEAKAMDDLKAKLAASQKAKRN